MMNNGRGRLPGQLESIVDHAMFEQVRAVTVSRRSRKAARAPAKFLFSSEGYSNVAGVIVP